MTIPVGSGRTARPSVIRLTSGDFGAIPDGATDGQMVTLAEAKKFINVEHDEDDSLITDLIHSAESRAETRTCRDLRDRNYEAFFATRDVPSDTLFFSTDRAALSVTSVKMWDDTGTLTTLVADTDYSVLAGKDGDKVVALDTDALPKYSQGNDAGDFMVIAFSTADATSANLSGYYEIKRAILHMIAGNYETREEVAQGAPFVENPAVERLLRDHVKRLSRPVL